VRLSSSAQEHPGRLRGLPTQTYTNWKPIRSQINTPRNVGVLELGNLRRFCQGSAQLCDTKPQLTALSADPSGA
jgi:hypothetical protein